MALRPMLYARKCGAGKSHLDIPITMPLLMEARVAKIPANTLYKKRRS
jgi:hypothetical protein